MFETGRRGHGDLAVVSADGLSENILTHTAADSGNGAWLPDGAQIAYTERAPGYFSGKLQVAPFDASSGRTRGPVTLYTSPVDRGGGWSLRRPAWSPDSRTLAIVLQESGWDNVYLLSAEGGAPQPLTRGEQEDLDPVFSPDGKAVAIVKRLKKAIFGLFPSTVPHPVLSLISKSRGSSLRRNGPHTKLRSNDDKLK